MVNSEVDLTKIHYLKNLEDILQAEYDNLKKDKTAKIENILNQLGCRCTKQIAYSKVANGEHPHKGIPLHTKMGWVTILNDRDGTKSSIWWFIKGWLIASNKPVYIVRLQLGNQLFCFFESDVTAQAESLLLNGVIAVTMTS